MAATATKEATKKLQHVEVKEDKGMQELTDVIAEIDDDLKCCIVAITGACAEIAEVLKVGQTGKISATNKFGDEQLEIDVLADKVMFDQLKNCGAIGVASSEEEPTEVSMGGSKYSVAFDPLDGSSIIGTNFAVGTIFGIWPGTELLGRKGSELVCAGCACYGPRTTVSIAIDGMRPFELVYDPKRGVWLKTGELKKIEDGKMFAPGNLRATQTHEGYSKLVNYWITNKYTLRYTGGMVPDVNQIVIKGKGVFCNPATSSSPAKLRLLYECAPFAYLIEKCGGRSSDGEQSLLNVPISDLELRVQACYGSASEVERFEELVGPYRPS
mmetsp:Transcript_13199/g.40579  ORF Transcript_13199/g.40579 Transcript_13199/m.40579 type:complete len:327 (-) Transcript_13199:74-1054(-)